MDQTTTTLASSWNIVIPWSISLAFGIVVPGLVKVLSSRGMSGGWIWWVFGNAHAIMQEFEWSVQDYQKVLTNDDMVRNGTSQSKQWRIPVPGARSRDRVRVRTVEHNCGVCLHSFDLGQAVVWSSNRTCPHVFHKECMSTWFGYEAAHGGGEPAGCTCPTCRQSYILYEG